MNYLEKHWREEANTFERLEEICGKIGKEAGGEFAGGMHIDLNKVFNTEKLRGASLLVEKMDDIAAHEETKVALEDGNRYERDLIDRQGEVRRENKLNVNNQYWREQKLRIGRLNNVRIFLKLNA